MSSDREVLERILGGEIEQRGARTVPGLNPVEGVEFVYYQDDKKLKPKKLFKSLLDGVNPRSAKKGGRVSDSCNVVFPDGSLFHAMSYHGDLEGWRKDIEVGAKSLGLLLARIEGDQFIISDGRSIPLSDCKIEFS
ncbi:hypothetical protein QN382_23370 [Pseudomonas sp. 10B1]|uniref:hypothetical protein n=1 Tax=unclassified Pseudomonas TaxID=196821 RepID=UPI002AB4775E|nr:MULTISPECIES: hypothetical protein [unclassified Pseudomonas]MDY7560885.1 hypothetical protein [Pseudomonas sp. AB6]MEA9997437.1 hypothetical protein [Pseudomonas sp. AA4]MEB0089537.1 hypothetical protein [Pseudomonas sp. RTI1]MEB0128607.1 hypothetical protein [Pseudomonas sp. CCC1.2]MEB0155963.1 hypothetical protein [Pseudomonas sp. CCC4.3]